MQVSWIDPEEVASLAESLRPPARTPEPEPAAETIVPESAEPLLSDQAPSVGSDQDAVEATLDLPALRQKLQSIREKAIRAGLLTPQPEVVEAPAAVFHAPDFSTETPVEPEIAAPEPPPVVEPAPQPTACEAISALAETPITVESATPVMAPAPQPLVQVDPSATVKDRLQAFAYWTGQTWGVGDLLVVDEYGDLLWGPPKRSGLVISSMMAWNAAIRASAQAANGFQQIQQQTLVTGESLTIIPCQTRLGLLVIAWVRGQIPGEQETSSLREALTGLMNLMA
ncbi:hypothetical protein SAMN02745166_02376 [Prosthecobacter debontii]|uniref:Uncharacterized protein n=1 Tax=Prosthecobacter debontii TaxID=48467 RepID=A0A1T4Y497_9BACT|nr:hypothetical protein [Prosthecobacter debontii]SKA96338.1 hypothetical protein SAMN02745166_02376 [Prosthecobacter debontii]